MDEMGVGDTRSAESINTVPEKLIRKMCVRACVCVCTNAGGRSDLCEIDSTQDVHGGL